MTTPHPQADILRAIADGKTIESRLTGKNWSVRENPQWLVGHPDWELRIKPATITINGIDFPEPVREPLVDGTRYWFVSLEPNYGGAVERTWFSGVWDEFMLNNGLAHYTKEGAIAQSKAMLSMVARKDAT